jgi:hypothetical protein
VTAELRVTAPPVDVRLTVSAVIVPVEFVRLPLDVRLIVPIFPDAAWRLPATSSVPAFTLRVNVLPAPAEEALRVTAAAVSLARLTLAVEFTVSEDALMVLVPVNAMPAVPAVKFSVGALRIPAPVIPLAAPLAFSVNEEPELAFNVIALLLVSIKLTTPLELAVKFEAFRVLVPVKFRPALPDVRFTVAAFRGRSAIIPLAALVAFRVKLVPELASRVMAPL